MAVTGNMNKLYFFIETRNPSNTSSMEGKSGQKEHFLILINDLLILINDLLISINDFLILINDLLILMKHAIY